MQSALEARKIKNLAFVFARLPISLFHVSLYIWLFFRQVTISRHRDSVIRTSWFLAAMRNSRSVIFMVPLQILFDMELVGGTKCSIADLSNALVKSSNKLTGSSFRWNESIWLDETLRLSFFDFWFGLDSIMIDSFHIVTRSLFCADHEQMHYSRQSRPHNS